MDQTLPCEPIGIMGYMDPSIEKTKGVTHKSDVYSFGVVLFEMLCGREAFIQNDANSLLASMAIHHYEKKSLMDIIHPDLSNQMSPQSLLIYSTVAYSCLKEERHYRPTMATIVTELERALKFQLRRENLIPSTLHYDSDKHNVHVVCNFRL
ncbi:hypothetical protein QVD17_16135 [Tagetes erecta]|uniref:Protein kinase domain-containing protein n=1 Tax=Tagetes erecta TaxID=13708 RepID=A0AAD8KRJ9_TARER|nr:hypothetical protein QVD17_16135 [Tagetes erecta]